MPRARNLKPGFFKNEHLALLTPHARLLFIGLPTLADRAGRLEDRPLRIKAELFPFEAVDAESLLQELANSPGGFMTRYVVDGQAFIQICNFTKHQNPHHREPESVIPPYISEKPRACLGKASDKPEARPGISRPSRAESLLLNPYMVDDSEESSALMPKCNKDQKAKKPFRPPKTKLKRTFSEASKLLAKELQELLKCHDQTVFAKDWLLTSYASCEALLKQGKKPEDIRLAMRWLVSEWACRQSVTHFKHIASNYAHWERSRSTQSTSGKHPEDNALLKGLLAFPYVKHQLTGEIFSVDQAYIESGDGKNLYIKNVGSISALQLHGLEALPEALPDV